MAKLTEKQKRFCHEYLKDLNGTHAAIRAGYSKNGAEVQASKLLRYPKVSEYLQRLMNKRAEKVDISAEDVLNSILDIRARCMQEEPVIVRGEPTGEWKFDAANALKSNELIGKHIKLFTDRVEVAVTELPTIEIKRGKK